MAAAGADPAPIEVALEGLPEPGGRVGKEAIRQRLLTFRLQD
jgi:hypothetical protein